MITTTLVLTIGTMKNGIFQRYDDYDLDPDEGIYDILYNGADPAQDYAILTMHVTGWPDAGISVAAFRRIKTKSKNGSKYRWIVVVE